MTHLTMHLKGDIVALLDEIVQSQEIRPSKSEVVREAIRRMHSEVAKRH